MAYDKNHARFLLENMKAVTEMLAKPDATHYIGLSGGKDSAACLALAEFCGINYHPFICDTDHEKQLTYEYLTKLQNFSNEPFTTLSRITTEAEFAARRETIRKDWAEWYSPALRSKQKKLMGVREMWPPVSLESVDAACNALVPSGNNFKDRLMIHGAMPRKTGKFCSLEMKTDLAWDHIDTYLNSEDHGGEDIAWWSGVREQESANRRGLAMWEPCGMDNTDYVFNFRPIYYLKHEEVFAVLRYMGIPWNPLYEMGDGRVGCNECFESNKTAVRNSFTRDRVGLDFITDLERSVAKVSRAAIQNGWDHIPFFREAFRLERYNNWATAEEVFEWSKTKRGSDEVDDRFEITSCDSIYGLCN